jgi:hypothetical protein
MTIAKYLRLSTYKKESYFILVEISIHDSLACCFEACTEVAHGGWECVVEEAAHFLVAEKQRRER